MSLPDKRNYNLVDMGRIFEFDHRQWSHLARNTRTAAEKQKQIDEFQDFIKKRYRKLVMKYHPDHGGDQRDFQVLQKVYEMIQALKVQPVRPPNYVTVRVYTGGGSIYTDSTTTSTGGWWS